MFHLDFGFILGKHPTAQKYAAPKIRITSEMINAMGCDESGFEKFKRIAVDAFNYLRNSRNFILNLLFLMVDASIKDLPKDESIEILKHINDRF